MQNKTKIAQQEIDQVLLRKFRDDDELKLEQNAGNWDVQRDIANRWLSMITSYEALNPKMADFASRQASALFSSQNLSFSEALMSREERFCNILASQADNKEEGLSDKDANIYVNQCLPRKLVVSKVGKEI